MWNQVLLLTTAFGLGYIFATRKAQPKAEQPVNDNLADKATMGAFPAQNKGGAIVIDEGGNGKKKSKKKKSKKSPKAAPTEQDSTEPLLPAAAVVEDTKGSVVISEMEDNDDGDNNSISIETIAHKANEVENWESVGQQGVPAKRREAKPIPIHQSAWEELARDEDLDAEPEQSASAARVLRIGAAARLPPPPPRARREYVPPAPLTRKQRQNQKKAEIMREERAVAAEIQEQRLKQHQRSLLDVRSREQWSKVKRVEASKLPARPSSKTPNSTASVVDGMLIWD
ncbi:hypothetical protein LPJ66_001259 [Kickxella alabastrina]|uniref:Uncharacterized protein n=1 Tax=Kickxella alabastrina TaxID=61397 RepID=A0ACC1ITV6_9FUNG|nr:hypothetical protein LPJ66_001259 [Kickxella alabastrina]